MIHEDPSNECAWHYAKQKYGSWPARPVCTNCSGSPLARGPTKYRGPWPKMFKHMARGQRIMSRKAEARGPTKCPAHGHQKTLWRAQPHWQFQKPAAAHAGHGMAAGFPFWRFACCCLHCSCASSSSSRVVIAECFAKVRRCISSSLAVKLRPCGAYRTAGLEQNRPKVAGS